MGCYILAVGGTGNKILESVVYCAAVDGFYTESDGARAVIPEIKMLSVDVDTACGNTTRARRAADYYETLRAAFTAYPAKHFGFHTALRAQRWNMNLSRRAASVDKMTENHRRDQLLSRTIFSKTESSLEYSEGFRGHPDLGVLFFSDLLDSLDKLRAEGQPDEMNALLDEIAGELDRGERAKLILCGSIFGGTGASGIPAIARFLRERFKPQSDLFELGAMLMLPYYKVPPSSKSEELEIVVKSSAFLDKARTALQYYGMEGMIRESENDEKGTFDALYLLGLPPEAFVTTRLYSTGSQSQENDAHLLEWLATRCVASFFRTGFRGENAHLIDCYYYQLHTPAFCWQSFDEEEELYRRGYGGLLKAAALFFGECYSTLLDAAAGENGAAARVGYCAPYFSGLRRQSAGERARLEGLLDNLYHFFAFYANWMVQIVRTLPPTLREQRESERLFELAAENYDRLTQRRALLAQGENQNKAADQGDAGLTAEYQEALATRQLLLKRIGGSQWLLVLKNAQDRARESLYRQEEDTAQCEERVNRWRGEDSRLADPQALRQEEERLAAMGRVRDFMALRLSQIGEDVEAAIRENVTERYPTPEAEAEGTLPQNALLSSELTAQLHTLLGQYGVAPARRDRAVFDRACLSLQKGLDRLVKQRVPDRRNTAKCLAGLGGGTLAGQGAEGMLCSFLAALLTVVGEENAQ